MEFINQYHVLLPTTGLFEMAIPVLSKLQKSGVSHVYLCRCRKGVTPISKKVAAALQGAKDESSEHVDKTG